MKRNRKFLKVSNANFIKDLVRILIYLFIVCFFCSCCDLFLIGVHGSLKGSETGGGVNVKAGTLPVSEKLSLNGVLSYDYLNFTTGHDNLFKAATQIRHTNENSPLWFGGELGLVHDVSIYDEKYWNENPAGNGITIGGIAGYKLPLESLDMNIFSGLSLISFGEFKTDDYVVESSHSTVHFRVGVELKLPFSK